MKAVISNRKKALRIASGCVLALLAGLALAPGLTARTTTGLILAGKPAAKPEPTAPQPANTHHHKVPQPTPATSAKAQPEPAPSAEPAATEQPDELDEPTTFAIHELSEQHSYGSGPQLAAVPTGIVSVYGGSVAPSRASEQPQTAARTVQLGSNRDQSNRAAKADHCDNCAEVGDADKPASHPANDGGGADPEPKLPTANVPEPSSTALLAIGLIGLAISRRRA